MTARFLFSAVLTTGAMAILTACGGGGGSDDGGIPNFDVGAADEPAALDTRDAVARAAVAVQMTPGDLLDVAESDMDGVTCRTGSRTAENLGNNRARFVYNQCRYATGEGTQDILFDGIVIVECDQFIAGECVNGTVDFGDIQNPLTIALFASAASTNPFVSFGAVGPARLLTQPDMRTLIINTDFQGTAFVGGEVAVSILTRAFRANINSGVMPATLVLSGRFGLASDPITGNCLQGSVTIETLAPLTAENDNFDNGFIGGKLRFSAGDQTATATYNTDGSINVTDSTGNSQLVTAAEVIDFCTLEGVTL